MQNVVTMPRSGSSTSPRWARRRPGRHRAAGCRPCAHCGHRWPSSRPSFSPSRYRVSWIDAECCTRRATGVVDHRRRRRPRCGRRWRTRCVSPVRSTRCRGCAPTRSAAQRARTRIPVRTASGEATSSACSRRCRRRRAGRAPRRTDDPAAGRATARSPSDQLITVPSSATSTKSVRGSVGHRVVLDRRNVAPVRPPRGTPTTWPRGQPGHEPAEGRPQRPGVVEAAARWARSAARQRSCSK